ncbi:MAG TPA: glycosyltransferase family 4 protein [Acidimicrobiales bacterium]|nr:glycosyltransferase family 4 protein [Acidimicrobiales bacterium]
MTDIDGRRDHPSAPPPEDDVAGDATSPAAPATSLAAVAADALHAGLQRVHLLAWRDLDDPEAGGSELHAHRIASLWADAGLDVTVRASAVAGGAPVIGRHGYRAIRKSGRYMVFPRSALSGLVARRGRPDGLVEVWNGMPFFSPLWARGTRMVFLHHVHAEMWGMTLPPVLARAGELIERRIAPPLYRHTPVVTLSESSRQEIVSMLRLPPQHVSVVPPGVDARFGPGPGRSATPMVLAVGRLVPVKRFPMLIDALVAARREVPGLSAVIVGEGYARPEVEAAIRRAGAGAWIELAGARSDEELLSLYRRAWVLASASLREGWGMTVTEAGACGTPAVVTRIAGHVDAVEHGVSGLLVDDAHGMATALVSVFGDRVRRERLRRGAEQRAAALTWEATAAGTLQVLVDEHRRRRQPVSRA